MEGSEILWNDDINYEFVIMRACCRFLGIWALDEVGLRVSLLRLWTASMTALGPSMFCILWYIYGYCNDIIDTVDAICFICGGYGIYSMVILHMINTRKISIVLSSAMNDWITIKDKKMKKIMVRYAYIARMLFITLESAVVFALLPLSLLRYPRIIEDYDSLSNTTIYTRTTAFGPKCWIPMEVSNFLYIFYWIINAYLPILLSLIWNVLNGFVFCIALHIIGQFQLLRVGYLNFDDEKGSEIDREKIVRFAKRHNYVLQMANNFSLAFSMGLLVAIGTYVILASVSGIVILWSMKNGKTELLLPTVLRLYTLMAGLFMYFFIGELLSLENEQLQNSIYKIKWYMQRPAVMKDIMFIMLRNNSVVGLSAGGALTLNLMGFNDVLKSIYSYLSMARLALNQ